MSRRKNPRSEEPEEDWGQEEFDIPEGPATPDVQLPARQALTADQVAAVRFHTSRPGYSFEQVEIFVDQVKESLGLLEESLYQKDVALYEAKEEQGELQDKISTLAATIEVFRAKGDPVVRSDGSYMTESQKDSQHEEVSSLQSQVHALTQELAASRTQNAALSTSVASLQAALTQAESLREEAEAAEEELRNYIDNVLGPWIANAEEQSMSIQGARLAVDDEQFAGVPVETPSIATAEIDMNPAEQLEGQAWGSDDWGADAPTVGGGPIESDEELATAPDPSPLPPVPSPPASSRGKAKLIDAPELQG